MIELLIDIERIMKKPHYMFPWAFVLGSIAILISNVLAYKIYVPNSVNLSGLFSVLFAVIPAAYFITRAINAEEAIEEKYIERHLRKSLWKRHEKYILTLLFFFAGVTVSFALWSMVLSPDFFQIQTLKINSIQGRIMDGLSVDVARTFNTILVNNLQVMSFSILFSFIFGAGAIFIIMWNASVLGVYIGELSKSLWDIPIVSLSFLPHGIPEIAGYVVAGFAGSIISVAILRGNTNSRVLRGVLFDAGKLIILAIVLIALGAFIEAYF